jgi:hypothetical protein
MYLLVFLLFHIKAGDEVFGKKGDTKTQWDSHICWCDQRKAGLLTVQ